MSGPFLFFHHTGYTEGKQTYALDIRGVVGIFASGGIILVRQVPAFGETDRDTRPVRVFHGTHESAVFGIDTV